MKANKGFTLIELLVVIAIIGILSSVVLASLNTARSKGANAAIKANLANIRAQAEIVYDDSSGAYGTVAHATGSCGTSFAPAAGTLFVNTTILSAIKAAATAAGASGNCASSIGTGSAWAVSMPLKATEGSFTHWCVDSTGVSAGKAAIASGTAC